MEELKATRESVTSYIQDGYGSPPEYLWQKYPFYAVFRRSDNRKWFAVIMDIPKNKLGLVGEERVDILDIKCNDVIHEIFKNKQGFLPAYHMNRENWITVLLDGSVDAQTVFELIDESFELAKPTRKPRIKK